MASRAEFVAYQTGHAAGVVAPVEGGGHRLGQVAGQRLGQLPEELDEFLVGERRKGGGDGPDGFPARRLAGHAPFWTDFHAEAS